MGIQRYSTGVRSYYFDPSTKGSLDPILGSVANQTSTQTNNVWNYNIYPRSALVGTSNPGLCWVPSPNAITALGSSIQLYFGSPVPANLSATSATYLASPAQNTIPIIGRGQNNSYVTGILRFPIVSDATAGAAPYIYFGIWSQLATATTQQASIFGFTPFGNAHTVGNPGLFNMALGNIANTVVTTTQINLTGDTDYRFVWACDAAGNATFSIAGTTYSITHQYPRGNMFIGLSNQNNVIANIAGIRDLRFIVS